MKIQPYYLLSALVLALSACGPQETDELPAIVGQEIRPDKFLTRMAEGETNVNTFVAGDRLQGILSHAATDFAEAGQQRLDLTYAGTPGWAATNAASAPLPRWQHGGEHTAKGWVLPAGCQYSGTDSRITIAHDQSKWTDYHAADVLCCQKETYAKPVSSFGMTLKHVMAQIVIELVPGYGMESRPIEGAKVKLRLKQDGGAQGIVGPATSAHFHTDPEDAEFGKTDQRSGFYMPYEWIPYQPDAAKAEYYALVWPDQTMTEFTVEVTAYGKTFAYTSPDPGQPAGSNSCWHIRLNLNDYGIKEVRTSVMDWQTVKQPQMEVAEPLVIKVTNRTTPAELANILNGLSAEQKESKNLVIEGDGYFEGSKYREVYPLIAGYVNDNGVKMLNLKGLYMHEAANVHDQLFMNNTTLTSVILADGKQGSYDEEEGEGLISIGEETFKGCTSLQSVNMPVVNSIGPTAFKGCTALTSIDMPQAGSISEGAFKGCTSLTSIYIPGLPFEAMGMSHPTGIDTYVFEGCTKLASVYMPGEIIATDDVEEDENGVEGMHIFKDCPALRNLVWGGNRANTALFGSLSIIPSAITLYLTHPSVTAEEVQSFWSTWQGGVWQTIYYGYLNSGKYDDPTSYTECWKRPQQPS